MITVAEQLIAEAQKYVRRKVRETPFGSNRGLEIDYWLKEAGLDPVGAFPWCCVFASQMGVQTLGRNWPLKYTASCQALATEALTRKVLKDEPQVGDLFLLWFDTLKPARYGHIGIVTSVSLPSMSTIEGNASDSSGTREGYGVFEKSRRISPTTKFVRWTDLL